MVERDCGYVLAASDTIQSKSPGQKMIDALKSYSTWHKNCEPDSTGWDKKHSISHLEKAILDRKMKYFSD